jgi:hypothetical protein
MEVMEEKHGLGQKKARMKSKKQGSCSNLIQKYT